MNKPDECSVCCSPYSESERRPRTLQCGHSYCSSCVRLLIGGNLLCCPCCRAHHHATSVEEFPISFDMEVLVRELNAVRPTQQFEVPTQDASKGISTMLRSAMEIKKSSVSSHIDRSQNTLSQLTQYCAELRNWREQHRRIAHGLCDLMEENQATMTLLQKEDEREISMMREAEGKEQMEQEGEEGKKQLRRGGKRRRQLLERNDAALVLIQQEDDKVMAVMREGETRKEQLEASLRCLEGVSVSREVINAISHAERHCEEVKKWNHKCLELFPDATAVTESWKVRKVTKERLNTVVKETAATYTPASLPESPTSITAKVNAIVERVMMAPLLQEVNVDELFALSPRVKKLVERNLLVAVHEDHGRLHSSKITLENGLVYLHCLQELPPPQHACTVPIPEVLDSVNTSPTLVFLDLRWGGSTRGRLHIRLRPSSPQSLQFPLLCTGQRGHSYLNTTLLQVCNKGTAGEYVAGGDYQFNNGRGGAALVSPAGGNYGWSGKAGSVGLPWGPADTSHAAQFAITTRDVGDGGEYCDIFGEVVSGLQVLREAVNHRDIREVNVADCGVVINHNQEVSFMTSVL